MRINTFSAKSLTGLNSYAADHDIRKHSHLILGIHGLLCPFSHRHLLLERNLLERQDYCHQYAVSRRSGRVWTWDRRILLNARPTVSQHRNQQATREVVAGEVA
jgi:hypothetical protein